MFPERCSLVSGLELAACSLELGAWSLERLASYVGPEVSSPKEGHKQNPDI